MKVNRSDRSALMVELGKILLQKDARYQEARTEAYLQNPWFVPKFIDKSLDAIANSFLEPDLLINWLSSYELPPSQKNIGLIMAGNLPLVGFHDLLSVLMAGHKAIVKLSSKDKVLMEYILNQMIEIDSRVEDQIQFVERIKDHDAIIATGSNNSSRYFEYYFSKVPHIIRKNRNGCAVLTGDESDEDIRCLANDVFDYFGLGCRNVTKIYVPRSYDFSGMLKVFDEEKEIIDHHKYKNNYDYNYALYLMNKVKFLVNNNLLLIEDSSYLSRIACLHYEYYDDMDLLKQKLLNEQHLIQCIGTKSGNSFDLVNEVAFGESQEPALNDYADGVDTMEFLTWLK